MADNIFGVLSEDFDEEVDSTVDEETTEDEIDEIEIDSEDDVQEDDQESEEKEDLLAGRYKTFGGLASAYLKQRRQLGLPEDLQNYNNPEALEKAFLRDKKRLEKHVGSEEKPNKKESSVSVDEIEDMNYQQLMLEYQKQQQELMASMMQLQQPNQNNQSSQQNNQVKTKSKWDDWHGDPSEWIENELMTHGPKAIVNIINDIVNSQGEELGKALYGVLQPMHQTVMAVKSQVDYDKEARKLSRKYDDFDDMSFDMEALYKKYPALAHAADGMETAYKMAKTQKLMVEKSKGVSKRQEVKKAAARMPNSSGNGVLRTNVPVRQNPDDYIKQSIFGGTSKKKKTIFD